MSPEVLVSLKWIILSPRAPCCAVCALVCVCVCARAREGVSASVSFSDRVFCLYIRHRSVECCVNWDGVPVGNCALKAAVCLFLKIAAHVCSAMRRWEIMPTVLPLGSLVLITNSCYKLALLMWPAWKSIINSGLLISPIIILGDHTWVFSSTHTRAGDTQHSSEVK